MLEKIDVGNTWTRQSAYCRHPEHDPPNMIVLEPGTYRHTCPGCGRQVVFVIPPGPICNQEPQ